MKPLVRILLLLCLLAAICRATTPIATEPTLRLDLGVTPEETVRPKPFRVEWSDVSITGTAAYDFLGQAAVIEGEYVTRQLLDPEARLSYQLYADDLHMVHLDGERFVLHEDVPGSGERRAHFRIVRKFDGLPGLRPVMRIQFNYVVEQQYWFRDKFPEVSLPQLAIERPSRTASFSVPLAWVPPILPRGVPVWLPAVVRAEYGRPGSQYMSTLDVLAADSDKRFDAVRTPLSRTTSGFELVWCRLPQSIDAPVVRVRPGLVWERVQWFSSYPDNPYRRVRMVGKFTCLSGLVLSLLALCAGWRRVAAMPRGVLRWFCVGGLSLLMVGVVYLAAPSLLWVMAGVLLSFWWMQRRIRAPGIRLYWTMWVWVVLLELYWGHLVASAFMYWTGTLTGICSAAVVLLPLRLMRHPLRSAVLGAILLFLGGLISTGLMSYYTFFHDFPGLRDALYAEQLGELGDTLRVIFDQDQLLPWLLTAIACWGLWRPVFWPPRLRHPTE